MFNIAGEATTQEEMAKGDKEETEATDTQGYEYQSTTSHSGTLLRDLTNAWAIGWELVNLYPAGEVEDEVTGKMVQKYDVLLRRAK